ncbi:MAG TPA: hypothetical protein VKA21_16435, partial [Candidatus Binatia bacterium]|nr:hypothetical protein [Candidatus Binatia bacterium]
MIGILLAVVLLASVPAPCAAHPRVVVGVPLPPYPPYPYVPAPAYVGPSVPPPGWEPGRWE